MNVFGFCLIQLSGAVTEQQYRRRHKVEHAVDFEALHGICADQRT